MSFTGVLRKSDTEDRANYTLTKDKKYVYCDFSGLPMATTCDTPYSAPTGTGGDVNNLHMNGIDFQYHALGTQTILAPSRTSAGLNITQDLTNNDGVEYTLGVETPANTVIATLSKGTFTVGTDAPFAFALKFTIADVSGSDVCIMGFRKMEAYQAAHSSYDELCSIGNISGDIKTYTILNGGTPATTDTTLNWADAETHTLTVICDSDGSLMNKGAGGQTPSTLGGAGRCYFEVDGVKPTTTAAFKFDAGEVVVPFFYFINDTDVAETTTLVEWESGIHPIAYTKQLAKQGSTTDPGA